MLYEVITLEDEMAEVIIRASITEGDTISIGFDKKNEKIVVKILGTKERNNFV